MATRNKEIIKCVRTEITIYMNTSSQESEIKNFNDNRCILYALGRDL